MKSKFIAEAQNGILLFHNEVAYIDHIRSLTGKVAVTVEPYRATRSDRQNRYYWAVVVELLASELGYTKDEMHEALKWKFLRIERDLPTVKSTSKLNTKEMEEYHAQIRMWASAELGIFIPDPNSIDYD